jgi:multidrug efflux system membrane fusion protein
MNKSVLIAAGLAVAVAAWVFSGQIDRVLSADADGNGHGASLALDTDAGPSEAEPTVPEVQVATLSARPWTQEIEVLGRTRASRKVDVKSETKGTVAEVLVEKGARVAAGDAIVKLAMEDRRARLRETAALVDQRRLEYDAAIELSRKNFRAKTQVAAARALLDSARAAYERAELEVHRTTIKAPFDGIVETRPVEVGDFVDVGTPIAGIVDLTPIKITGEVSERDIGKVALGDSASAKLIDGDVVAGKVSYVARASDAATRTFHVEVEVDNVDGRLREGMTATLRIDAGKVMAHRLTPAVLTLDDDGRVGVKAVDADRRVVFHPVQLVADTPEGVWLSGLPDTVTLITVGQEFVTVGQRVRPVPAGVGSGQS